MPELLDEVYWLIENRGLRFILCGLSSRKLRRGRANLFGGRAWRYEMFPFVTTELGSVDLLRVLNRGMIPSHYLSDGHRRSLDAYVRDYLSEEVFAEGLTRNVVGSGNSGRCFPEILAGSSWGSSAPSTSRSRCWVR